MHINFATKNEFKFKFTGFKAIEFNRLVMLIVAGLIAGIMLSFGLVQKFRLDSQIKERTHLEAMQSKNTNKIKTKTETIITTKLSEKILKNYTRRPLWSEILQDISTNIPTSIWLSQIKTDPNNTSALEITGQAPNQLAVASLIEALSQATKTKSVKLISSEQAKQNANRLVFVLRYNFITQKNKF